MGLLQDGLLISTNSKTGLSLNVDQCTPTRWCLSHCYRLKRTKDLIRKQGWDTTVNNGPITWPVQQARYKANEERIKSLYRQSRLPQTAAAIATRLRRRGMQHFRGNGTGDLFFELCHLYALLSLHGVKVYGYSKRPAKLHLLAALCRKYDTACRPFFLGSTDPSSTQRQIKALTRATAELNGAPALTFSTECTGVEAQAQLAKHCAAEHVYVVFGYHANSKQTVTGLPNECPATAGEDIHCRECRKCFAAQPAQ